MVPETVPLLRLKAPTSVLFEAVAPAEDGNRSRRHPRAGLRRDRHAEAYRLAVSDCRGREAVQRGGRRQEGDRVPFVDQIIGVDRAEASGQIIPGARVVTGEDAVDVAGRMVSQLGLPAAQGISFVPTVTSLKIQLLDSEPLDVQLAPAFAASL